MNILYSSSAMIAKFTAALVKSRPIKETGAEQVDTLIRYQPPYSHRFLWTGPVGFAESEASSSEPARLSIDGGKLHVSQLLLPNASNSLRSICSDLGTPAMLTLQQHDWKRF